MKEKEIEIEVITGDIVRIQDLLYTFLVAYLCNNEYRSWGGGKRSVSKFSLIKITKGSPAISVSRLVDNIFRDMSPDVIKDVLDTLGYDVDNDERGLRDSLMFYFRAASLTLPILYPETKFLKIIYPKSKGVELFCEYAVKRILAEEGLLYE